MKTFLHVGCGPLKLESTPFAGASGWSEVRMDLAPEVAPDIIGSMTNMREVADGRFDAVYSSHSIEHLYPHEVPTALGEFKRVLRADGFALITCPDLQSVCALVAAGGLTDPAYMSPAGPIAPLDILYGYRPALAKGEHFMAHRTGFTQASMTEELARAGFAGRASMRRGAPYFDLWFLASPTRLPEPEIRAQATVLFPPPA